ncbi:MAG: translocation/assembly module TamB, partial [Candidatus Latescibacterota bacterium]
RMQMDFSGWPKLSKYLLGLEASLKAAGATELCTSEGDGFAGTLTLERQGRLMMKAEVRGPLAISLKPPVAEVDDTGNINIEVVSDSIPLEDFDPLLPSEVGLGGLLSLSFNGSGPIRNPELKGTIASKGFEMNAADQARMTGDLDIRIGGTRKKPEIKGEIRIDQAFIRVPDQSEDLHPIDGEAILLVRDSLGAEADTIRLAPSASSSPPQQTVAPSDLNLDVNVIIPSGFWVRGKGLDLELSGDLNIKQHEGKPTVTGELRVIRGTLVALGRRFELERGVVTFYGGDEIDPSLDVVLGTEIEGTKIQILFGGTTQAPELRFASQPDMPEADIMSVLLFGRPYSQLDDGQVNLMRDRTREMLVSVGASKLQSKVGGQLGIDIVTVKSTGPDNAGTALSVGKYLNPQVLLSYAYALDKDSDSFVSLEYFLKGRFKVETIFGNKGQTSIGIGWSRDY